MNSKLKIAWICYFSNADIRSQIPFGMTSLERIGRKILSKRGAYTAKDVAQWNTNAFKELEKMDDVDVHVICPVDNTSQSLTRFTLRGINYYFFRSEMDNVCNRCLSYLGYQGHKEYRKNRHTISFLVKEIEPDIVVVMGAENPSYSLSVLDIPRTKPILVQLQTLLAFPELVKTYPGLSEQKECEQKVIKRADYIGTSSIKFQNGVKEYYGDKIILKSNLILGEIINIDQCKKSFDFIYFAASITKACDLAIEAFALARKAHPEITLDIVGECPQDYKKKLDDRIAVLGIKNSIRFEGKLATHDDVLCQLRKARYALLPLKTDLVSGTIRESLANNVPVITTDTGATPKINEKRNTVLISKIGDHQAMADNMIRLIEDPTLAEELRQNGILYMQERVSNADAMRRSVEIYKACAQNFYDGIPIPEEMIG